MPPPNPYETLGLKPDASDAEVRAAYRRLVQLHHPDHNGGSAEATRRFEQIQAAYTRITELRQLAPHGEQAESRPTDWDVDSRLADLEREVREAHAARERARRAAREAATRTQQRPTDEELGYVTTDDSLSKLLADVRTELAERLAKERKHPAAKGLGDLIDELASKLGGGEREPPRGRR